MGIIIDKEPRIIFHIGLHRTATSFIQTEIASNLIDCTYLGKKELAYFYQRICFSTIINENDILNIRNDIFSKAQKNNTILISIEDLSGSPWHNYVNRESILNNIARVFPEAEIAVLLRNQLDFITSLYTQSIKGGNYKSLENSLTSYSLKKLHFPHMLKELNLNIESLDFNILSEQLSDKFDSSKIHFFFYENIELGSSYFFISTFEKLGIKLKKENIDFSKKVNRSLGLNQIKILKKLNYFISSSFVNLGLLSVITFNKLNASRILQLIRKYNTKNFKNKIETSDFISEELIILLENYYRTKNKEFATRTGLNVPKKYFY